MMIPGRPSPNSLGWRERLTGPAALSRRSPQANLPYMQPEFGFFSGENLVRQRIQQAQQAAVAAQQHQQTPCGGLCQLGCLPMAHSHARSRCPMMMAPPHSPENNALVHRPPPMRHAGDHHHHHHHHHGHPRLPPQLHGQALPPMRCAGPLGARHHGGHRASPVRHFSDDDDEYDDDDPLGLNDRGRRGCCGTPFGSDDDGFRRGQRRPRSVSVSSESSDGTSAWSLLPRPRRRRGSRNWDDAASWTRERRGARWFDAMRRH